MAYDAHLVDRIRQALAAEAEVAERRMFGGVAFFVRGHMTVVASSNGGLMLRADPTKTANLVESTPADFAEMRGRPMKGWLRLASTAVASDTELNDWIEQSVRYSSTLPPKT